MQLILPVNFNYGENKGFTESELKNYCIKHGGSFNKTIVKRCFESYEEIQLNQDRFSNLHIFSLRKQIIDPAVEDAFVIKFYKQNIGGEIRYFIETGQYAGYLYFKGLAIHISLSEKYNRTVLNHLLTYANNISIDSQDVHTHYSDCNELEYVLAFLFVQSLEKASFLGLPKEYKTIDDHLSKVRGKIDFNRYMQKDVPFKGKIAVQYRDRVEVQEIVDVLFYALYTIKKNISSAAISKVRNVYNELLYKYSKKKPHRDTILRAKNHPVLLNPIFKEFRKVIELAEIIIREFTPDFEKDKGSDISGSLYNTSELYELYIEKVLRIYMNDWLLEAQKEVRIYQSQFFKRKLKPDFVLFNADLNKYIILDAKFKTMNYNKYDLDREDLFQLHTYAYYYHQNIALAGLVYPLQSTIKNIGKGYGKILDQFTANFGVLGVELNKDSTVESIKRSEYEFIDQINEMIIDNEIK